MTAPVSSRILSWFVYNYYANIQVNQDAAAAAAAAAKSLQGVGCHFLLQCMKVKSEREVAQSCPTLCDPMDRSLPGSPVHEIFQARVLEWGAIAFSESG